MVWSQWFDLTPNEVANEAPATCGVFCIARKATKVAYPKGLSATILLGAAPGRQRGLRAVLTELAAGRRDDLERERKDDGGLRFCFQANLGDGADALHTAILEDFAQQHGAPPRCNAGQ